MLHDVRFHDRGLIGIKTRDGHLLQAKLVLTKELIYAICTVFVPFLLFYLPIEDQNTLSLRCSTVLSPSASNPDLWHFSLERELVLRHKLQLNVHNGDTLYKRAIQKLARYFTFCKIRSFRCSYTEIAQFHKNDRQNIKLNCRM